MRIRVILLIVVATALCTGNVNSQIISTAKKAVLPEKDKMLIDKQISNYTVFTLDTKELLENLGANDHCHVRLYINEQWNWEIDFVPNDGEGIFEGKTSDNETVFLSIAENYFHGTILGKKGDYLIRSSWFYTQNFTDKSLIAHKASDTIGDDSGFDVIDDVTSVSQEDGFQSMVSMAEESAGTAPLLSCPVTLELAIDADYDLYLRFGSDTVKIKNFINNEMKLVKEVYERTFDLKLKVNYIHIWTSNTAPDYPYIPLSEKYVNADSLLLRLGNYWNNHMTHIPRNVVHLFTGKDSMYAQGHPKVGGISSGGNIKKGRSLTVYQGFMYQTIAHEIGHDLGAGDNPRTCGCDTTTLEKKKSLMCQGDGGKRDNLWFCTQSINEIFNFLTKNMSTLMANSSNKQLLSGTLTGNNEYQRTLGISSTQIISSGYTSYKSGTRIELTPGFRVTDGARFTGVIDEDILNCGDASLILPASSRSAPSHFTEENRTTEMLPPERPRLYQNHPNPFTGQTTVGYYLPEGVGTAWLRIMNAGGVTVKTVNIAGFGEGSIILDAGSLDPGVYFCSLLVDGEIIDTKRMLTE